MVILYTNIALGHCCKRRREGRDREGVGYCWVRGTNCCWNNWQYRVSEASCELIYLLWNANIEITMPYEGLVWYLYYFHSLSGDQGILILQIAVGEHALIVGKKVIQWRNVQQLSGRNHALFAGVWSTVQSNAQRCIRIWIEVNTVFVFIISTVFRSLGVLLLVWVELSFFFFPFLLIFFGGRGVIFRYTWVFYRGIFCKKKKLQIPLHSRTNFSKTFRCPTLNAKILVLSYVHWCVH
jgi:hypothetical protein